MATTEIFSQRPAPLDAARDTIDRFNAQNRLTPQSLGLYHDNGTEQKTYTYTSYNKNSTEAKTSNYKAKTLEQYKSEYESSQKEYDKIHLGSGGTAYSLSTYENAKSKLDSAKIAYDEAKKVCAQNATNAHTAAVEESSNISNKAGSLNAFEYAESKVKRTQTNVDYINALSKYDDITNVSDGKAASLSSYELAKSKLDKATDAYYAQLNADYASHQYSTAVNELMNIEHGNGASAYSLSTYEYAKSKVDKTKAAYDAAVKAVDLGTKHSSYGEIAIRLDEIEALKKLLSDERNRIISLSRTAVSNPIYNDKTKTIQEQIDELNAEYNSLLPLFYNYDNTEKLAKIATEIDNKQIFATGREEQQDGKTISALIQAVSASRFDDEYYKNYDYIAGKYGITQENSGGMDGYVNSLTHLLQTEGKKLVKNVETLKNSDYKFFRMSEYMDRLEEHAKAEQAKQEQIQFAKEHPAAASVATMLAAPFQGLDFINVAADNIGHYNRHDYENYAPLNTDTMIATNLVNNIRGQVASDIEEKYDWKIFEQNLASFIYNTGMTIGDSVIQTATFGTGAILFMGSSAAANGAQNITQRGGTSGQAFWGGLAQGTAEAIFEKFSVGNLLKAKNINSVKSLVKSVAIQSGVEASEEMATQVANIISDAVVMGQSSDFNASVQKYIADGNSEEKARQLALLDMIEDVALAGASGLLSGFSMGGAVNTANYTNNALNGNLQSQLFQNTMPNATYSSVSNDTALSASIAANTTAEEQGKDAMQKNMFGTAQQSTAEDDNPVVRAVLKTIKDGPITSSETNTPVSSTEVLREIEALSGFKLHETASQNTATENAAFNNSNSGISANTNATGTQQFSNDIADLLTPITQSQASAQQSTMEDENLVFRAVLNAIKDGPLTNSGNNANMDETSIFDKSTPDEVKRKIVLNACYKLQQENQAKTLQEVQDTINSGPINAEKSTGNTENVEPPLIDPPSTEGAGDSLSSKIYTPVDYKGTVKVNGEVKDVSRRVYQRNDIDINYFDETTGLTNLERMQAGKPPIGTDGNPVELHHVLQQEAGPMAELREITHQQYYSQLHGLIENGASFRNNPLLNKQYNNFRYNYWKWRASLITGGK